MEIRPANPADLIRVRDIATAAYEKYVARIGRVPAPMQADFEAHLFRHELYVAGTSGGIQAYLVAFPRIDDYFVENVAVDPAVAGAGIGKKLMKFAEGEAKRAGRSRILLYTNVLMTENFPFYEGLGYQKTHEITEAGFRRVYFEKVLEQA